MPAAGSAPPLAAAALEPVKNAYVYTMAMTHFARGYGAARLGDSAAASREAEELARLKAALDEQKDKYWATEVEVQRLAVVAWGKLAGGDRPGELDLEDVEVPLRGDRADEEEATLRDRQLAA